MMRRQWIARLAPAAAVLVVVAGCGGSPKAGTSESQQRTIRVFAASSLTELLTDLAATYEKANPGVDVEINFGSSSTLAQQIDAGAPVDVFAAASPKTMAAAGSRIIDPLDYVSNHVVVAVPAPTGSDFSIAVYGGGVTELENARTWIQCAHEVPCGAAADAAITAFGVESTPASLEPDVKSVVAKLLAGEADAGIVYVTDVFATRGRLKAFEFGMVPADSQQARALSTQYRIARVDNGPAASDARAFIDYLMSDTSLQAAKKLGFGIPAATP